MTCMVDQKKPTRTRSGRWRGRVGTAVAGLAVFGLGIGSPLVYHKVTAPGGADTDAVAARVDTGLTQLLSAGFRSPGHSFGARFSTGTLTALVTQYGGITLSLTNNTGTESGNSIDVMLGLNPATTNLPVAAAAYPIRCYRIGFGSYARTVQPATGIACPTTRTDGRPGSAVAEFGALLALQSGSPTAMATNAYPQTSQGVLALLHAENAVAADDVVHLLGIQQSGSVLAAAVRLGTRCEFVRLDSSTQSVIPVWLAPTDQQATCSTTAALSESALHGTDAAREG